ncbi:MAG: FkbM family methyltransferase [Polyangiales bacterium]
MKYLFFALFAVGCGRQEPSPVAAAPSVSASASAPLAGPAPRYVFVDGGAHIGETVLAFENSALFKQHTWTAHSFEPNPELVPKIPKKPFLTLHEEAIWTKDETLEFQFSDEETLGGSVMDSVVKFKEMKKVKVKAIDFGQWLKKLVTKNDVVHVKLDIEGAEYPVLEQMLKDGTMALVDKLYIEFHGIQQAVAAKKPAAEVLAIEHHDYELVEAITSLGVAISIHHNDEAQGDYFRFDPAKYGITQ